MTKVKLPRDVAEAIDYRRNCDFSDYAILRNASDRGSAIADVTIRKWAFDPYGEGSPDLLMQALVNGYEVEKKPEEAVREYYTEIKSVRFDRTYDWKYRDLISNEMLGVRQTLNKLGIKIEGVND